MFEFPKRVLAFHAHPDDTESFCSGTLALLKEKGYEIIVATMTAGGMGGINSTECQTIVTRKKEAAAAAKVLGAEYCCFDQRDGFVFDSEDLRHNAVELIRDIKPGIIMTHLPSDYHSDHRTTAAVAEIGAMLSTLPNLITKSAPLEITPLLYHTTPLSLTNPVGGLPYPTPTFYVDITSVIDKKMEMLSKHETQIDLMRVMHKMDNFFEEMKKNNVELAHMAGGKAQYAEAFWQHLGGGFQKDGLIQQELKDFIIYPKPEMKNEN